MGAGQPAICTTHCNATPRSPDNPMATVVLDGRDVYYESPRDPSIVPPGGSTVLLVHGMCDNHKFWTQVSERLSVDHTPVAVLLPGRGESDGPPLDSAADYLRFFEALVEALGLSAFVFCGHSMGGSMGLELALRRPDLLRGLILVSAAPSWPMSQDDIEIWDRDPDEAYRVNFTYLYSPHTSDTVKQKYNAQLKTTPAATCRADAMACKSFASDNRLEGIHTPALVVCGEHEFWIDGSERLSKGLPQNRYVNVPRAGHAIGAEQPEQLADVIVQYLREL